MFEISETENSDSDITALEAAEDTSLSISKEKADDLFGHVGFEVQEEEDSINFDKYSFLFSDQVHLNLIHLLDEVRLPHELADFQKVALHAIGSGKNTILVSPTGSGKSLVVELGILLMRKILKRSEGVAIGTLPLSIILEEKVKTSKTPTAVVSLRGGIEIDEENLEEPTLSKPVSAVRDGLYPIIVGHPEAWSTPFGQNLVTDLKNGPGILLNFIDEVHQHGSDHWGKIRPEMKTVPGRLRIFLEPGAPTLAMSATL